MKTQSLVNMTEWAVGLIGLIVPSVVLFFMWSRTEKTSGYGPAERMDLKQFIQSRKSQEAVE